MQDLFITHSTIRVYIMRTVNRLTPEQWLAIPDGFENNIAWNVGHVIVAQMGLIYRPCGIRLDGLLPGMSGMYRPGTSPADWTEQPDIDALKQSLKATSKAMQADYSAGVFDSVDYSGMTTAAGAELTTLMQGVSFNSFHEGLHLGTIMALRDFVK